MKPRKLDADRQFRQAMQHYNVADFAPARRILDGLLQRAPRDRRWLLWITRCEVRMGQFALARRHLAQLEKLAPRDPDVHFERAVLLKSEGRVDEALPAVEKGLRLAPDHVALVHEKGDLLRLAGAFEEAWSFLRPFATRADAAPEIVITYGRVASRFEDTQPIIDLLEAVATRDEGTHEAVRAAALYEIVYLADRAGRHDEAMEAAHRANRAFGAAFDPEAFDMAVDQMIKTWAPAAYRALPTSTSTSDRPIFVLGMPRSGTTLIEQVLASHPEVIGAGETPALPALLSDLMGGGPGVEPGPSSLIWPWTADTIDAAAQRYLATIDETVGSETARVTDKLVYNFQRIGVIAKMFPRAAVVHCARDPLDTCLSCYFQPFMYRAPFTASLTALGHYYRGYQKIMAHWTEGLGIKLVEVSYEDFVRDQEPQTRRLLDAVGLPWDEGCLSFHEQRRSTITFSTEQVRQKVYTSAVGRHAAYEAHLEPLRQALAGR